MNKYYKAFSRDLKCRDFQYEEGKTYEIEEKPILCEKGFHFCKDLVLTLQYYPVKKDITENKYAEVEVLGDTIFEQPNNHKGVTNKIKILKVLSDEEVLSLVNKNRNSGDWNSGDRNSGSSNSGDRNSGYSNSGNKNSGYGNSGYGNSGDRNSGDRNSGSSNLGNWNSGHMNSSSSNSGDKNSGNWNSGHKNSGNWNSGNWNSGNGNSGDRNSGSSNSGNWNSGDWNSGKWNYCNNESGFFNSRQSEKIRVFNKFVNKKEWQNTEKPDFIYFNLIEGKTYKESFIESYNKATKEDRDKIYNLPNFNEEAFYEISGIDLRK